MSSRNHLTETQMAELEKLMFPIMQAEAIRLYRGPSSDATHPSHAGSNVGANNAVLAQLDFAFTHPSVLAKIQGYGLTVDPLIKQSMSGYLSSHGPVAQVFSFDEGGLGGTDYLQTRSWASTSKKSEARHTANPVVFSHPSKKPLKEEVDYSKDARYVQRRDLGREERNRWDLIEDLSKEEARKLMEKHLGSRDKVTQERFDNLTKIATKKDPGDKPNCTIQ